MPRKRTGADPFDKEFDLTGFKELEDFTWLAFYDCNLGNTGDWYGHFRGGYLGLRARLYGAQFHFHAIHEWTPRKRDEEELDYHLASILFGMDSAVECWVYALNALGCATAPADFRDVASDAALKNIRPSDVIGKPAKGKSKAEAPLPGYAKLFPEMQQYWLQEQLLLHEIFSQHDASKHRMATLAAGVKRRDDPPAGFFDALPITDELDRQEYVPFAEFYLIDGIKEPNERIHSGEWPNVFVLEEVARRFRLFIQKTGELAYQDAKTHIFLQYADVAAVNSAA